MKVVIKITRDKTWTDQPLELEFEEAKSLYEKLGEIFDVGGRIFSTKVPMNLEQQYREFYIETNGTDNSEFFRNLNQFDPYPSGFREKTNPWPASEPCLHDGAKPGTVSGLSCSCPKCSPRS